MNNAHSNDPNELMAKALRGELSDGQKQVFEQLLRSDEAVRTVFAEEKALQKALDRLPNAPVPSNFTSLVLQAVHAEKPRPARGRGMGWFSFRFARVAAGLATFAAAGLITIHQFRRSEQREIAQSISAFTEVAQVIGASQASPAVLFQDFETIQKLSVPAESELDLDLLVALQK